MASVYKVVSFTRGFNGWIIFSKTFFDLKGCRCVIITPQEAVSRTLWRNRSEEVVSSRSGRPFRTRVVGYRARIEVSVSRHLWTWRGSTMGDSTVLLRQNLPTCVKVLMCARLGRAHGGCVYRSSAPIISSSDTSRQICSRCASSPT